jgi:hypothetical protein
LIKAIRTFLLTKTTRAYLQKAPENATFPYATFKLPSSFDSRPFEDFTLEIDLWDIAQDTTAIENLSDSIDGDGDALSPTGLNRKTISNKIRRR